MDTRPRIIRSASPLTASEHVLIIRHRASMAAAALGNGRALNMVEAIRSIASCQAQCHACLASLAATGTNLSKSVAVWNELMRDAQGALTIYTDGARRTARELMERIARDTARFN